MYGIRNKVTGQIEQAFSKKKDADEVRRRLEEREPELHLGEPVLFETMDLPEDLEPVEPEDRERAEAKARKKAAAHAKDG